MNSSRIRIVVFVILLALFLGGGFFWWNIGMTSVNPQDQTLRDFVVQKGEGVRAIASRLKQDGFIRDQIVFFLLVKKLGIDQNLQAGNYRLSPSMDTETVAKTLTRGMFDIKITLREGLRSEEIATVLTQDLGIPASEFENYAQEGYMFPDTYFVSKDATGAAIATLLKDTFNKNFDETLKRDAAKKSLTPSQVIVMASIVEKEAAKNDKNVIAGILLRRLKIGMALQADATVQYALGYQPQEHTWWKKDLTNEDKKINSPYNTYASPGLPPGPICNPGLASIKAVIYPTDLGYLYYLHDSQGNIHFAKTLEEHEANVAKYL